MKRILKYLALFAVLTALFAALSGSALADTGDPQEADLIDLDLVFSTETDLVVYVDGEWSGALSGSYVCGETAQITAPSSVSGKVFSHWEANGSVVSYAKELKLTMNAHTTLYAVYANSAPTAQAAAGFTSVTRTTDGKSISFQAIAAPNGGGVTGAGIVYSTTATGDSLVIDGEGVTNVAAEKITDSTQTMPESVLDRNNCWMLQVTPADANTVYHARAYVTNGAGTAYGDVKDVKLSELESGVSLIGKPDGIDDVLDDLRETFDPGSGDSGDNTPGYYDGAGTATYTPTVAEAANGKVTVDPKSAAAGKTVTITVTPDEGYEVDAVTVRDADGKDVPVTKNADGTYSYTQPKGKVTVTATFKEKEENADGLTVEALLAQFTDLDPKGWYLDDVRYCVENGMMNGVADGKFDPDGTATRAMIVTILYRLEGEPVIRSGMPFSDVKESDWYARAVSWAESLGIVTGFEDGTFRPNAPITREQLAAILYRYAQTKGQGFQGLWSFRLDFPDAGDVSDWATEAMSWMVMQGVINGMDGALNPQGDATRVQIAAMVHRFCELIK